MLKASRTLQLCKQKYTLGKGAFAHSLLENILKCIIFLSQLLERLKSKKKFPIERYIAEQRKRILMKIPIIFYSIMHIAP